MDSIGLCIQEARKKKGLTQERLATLAGLSRNYVSDIEGDRYTPSVKTIARLAKHLEMDLNFLKQMTEIQVREGSA